MRPPVSSCLYVQVDHDHATSAVPTMWEARGLQIQVAEAEPVRWGTSLMGVRWTGRWSRRRDDGGCTVDLTPAGAGRALVVLTLQPSARRLAAPVVPEACWSALAQLRAVLEADVVTVSAVRPPMRPPVTELADPLPAPTPPIASGILPV